MCNCGQIVGCATCKFGSVTGHGCLDKLGLPRCQFILLGMWLKLETQGRLLVQREGVGGVLGAA